MASLRQSAGGSFVICFWYGGRQFQRSLRTKDTKAAAAAKGSIEDRLHLISTGRLAVPLGIDPVDFVVQGEEAVRLKERQKPKPARVSPLLEQLIEPYLDAHRGLKEDSSLATERTHLNNLKKCLGAKSSRPVDRIGHGDLEVALQQRRRKATSTTVKKERQTILSFFGWAVRTGHLESSPAIGLPTYRDSRERPRFRTLEEIEKLISRGGLSDTETTAIWECLFLTEQEIGEILDSVKEGARHDFVHPMFALAAFTGMRRGEILRLRWLDVDFDAKIVTARSKKQSRRHEETSRTIDMHPDLERTLRAYYARRPTGQYVICPADTLQSLTVYMAHDHFQRTLRKTKWEREMLSGAKKVITGFHTFRHSFASNLAMRGVDQRIIDEWMGHQTEAMRKRYRHLFPHSRRSAIEMLSFAKARG